MNTNPVFNNRQNPSHKIGDREIWESRSPAVVAVIFALGKTGLYVLGEKRSDSMIDAPGKWVVPCGYMDWDENGWDALRREVFEETSFFIDKYKKYLVDDNDKQPFYVQTEPWENRQNIALTYYILYDFRNKKIPFRIEKYKDEEISQIKWISVSDLGDYDWAFKHDERIEMAIKELID